MEPLGERRRDGPGAGIRSRQGGLVVLVLIASVGLSWLLSFASKEARPELREREKTRSPRLRSKPLAQGAQR